MTASNEPLSESKSGERRVSADRGIIFEWLFEPFLAVFWGYVWWSAFSHWSGGFYVCASILIVPLAASLFAICLDAFKTPIVILSISGEDYVVREHWLNKSMESRFNITEESFPRVMTSNGFENNPIYAVELNTPERRTIVISKFTHRWKAEALISAMNLPVVPKANFEYPEAT